MEKIINITKSALDFFKSMVESEKCLGIRIDVAPGGCHGTSYSIDYVRKVNPADVLVVEDGVNVYVASRAAIFIFGMNMDYVKTAMGGNIVFDNPNAKAKCGCGKSFCLDNPDDSSCANDKSCC